MCVGKGLIDLGRLFCSLAFARSCNPRSTKPTFTAYVWWDTFNFSNALPGILIIVQHIFYKVGCNMCGERSNWYRPIIFLSEICAQLTVAQSWHVQIACDKTLIISRTRFIKCFENRITYFFIKLNVMCGEGSNWSRPIIFLCEICVRLQSP